MAPTLGRETFVVPLQNGVEAAASFPAVLGASASWAASAPPSASSSAPAASGVSGVPLRAVRRARPARSQSPDRALLAAFDRAGVRATIPDDIHVALWEKFLFVVSVRRRGRGPQAPAGEARSLPGDPRMLERAMEEILAVAAPGASRCRTTPVPRAMGFLDSLDPEGTASLQRDLAEGRPSELEAWNGAVVRLGREAGVADAAARDIYAALLPLERARASCSSPLPACGGRGRGEGGDLGGHVLAAANRLLGSFPRSRHGCRARGASRGLRRSGPSRAVFDAQPEVCRRPAAGGRSGSDRSADAFRPFTISHSRIASFGAARRGRCRSRRTRRAPSAAHVRHRRRPLVQLVLV